MINKVDIQNCSLINADCLDAMKSIEDKSIDMILCDLPYGTTQNKWDAVIPFDLLWKQYERIIKPNGAIVLFAQTPFDKILGCSKLDLLKYEFIWDKVRGSGFLNANKQPIKRHENILVFYKKQPTFNKQMKKRNPNAHSLGKVENYTKGSGSVEVSNYGYIKNKKRSVYENRDEKNPDTIIEITKGNNMGKYKTIHPTQKPVELMEYLIKTYTNEGETVLDNCMGSGTTGVACMNTNRKFIGIEKDEKYFAISVDRISKILNN